MKYNKDLLKIVEGKAFKSFWHCLDYLLMAGIQPMDAFGVSLKQYGESKIFNNVSFVRIETKWMVNQSQLLVGIIDESNIHLDGLYTVYRKKLNEHKNMSPISEIEETCEVIKISYLSKFLLEYLLEVTIKHFGEESFRIPTYKTAPIIPNNNRGYGYADHLNHLGALPRIEHPDDFHNGDVRPDNIIDFTRYLMNRPDIK